jgi:hypothetical protein
LFFCFCFFFSHEKQVRTFLNKKCIFCSPSIMHGTQIDILPWPVVHVGGTQIGVSPFSTMTMTTTVQSSWDKKPRQFFHVILCIMETWYQRLHKDVVQFDKISIQNIQFVLLK